VTRSQDHQTIIRRGLALHESRRYAAALPYFDRALRVAPGCPVAVYNRANTLHMLGRDDEAYPLLIQLTRLGAAELARRCPDSQPRSLRMDCHFLLFYTILGRRGFCREAIRHARTHLRLRCRGVQSLWSIRHVRRELADILRTRPEGPVKA
jgi:tetratricopeptide (TPR) repeat protein